MAKNLFAARFLWLSALPQLGVIAALVVIAIGALSSDDSGGSPVRDRFFDYYQRLMPAPSGGASPFYVISIDRDSADRVGPWPWPRTLVAELVGKARESGAKGIVVAVPVDAPDSLSPETIGKFWLAGARDDGLARQLAMLPSTDIVLADALAGARGAVAVAEARNVDPNSARLQRADIGEASWLAFAGAGGYAALPAARSHFDVNADLARAARLSVAALEPDDDGVLRRVTPLWSLAGAPAPSVGLEAALIASGAGEATVSPEGGAITAAGQILGAIDLDGRKIVLNRAGSIRLYLPRRVKTPETPAWRVLDNASSNSELKGKTVLIGLDRSLGPAIETAAGPLSSVQVHALAARQMLSGMALLRPDWAGYVEAIAVMLLGAAAIMWSQKLDFWKAIGVAALCSLALLVASVSAFAFGHLLVSPLPASLALFLGAFSVAGGRSLGVVLRDDTVRGSFQGSLPEPTMRKLREEGSAEILDGVLRSVTVLACELRLTDDDLQKLADAPDDVTKLIAAACLDLRKTIIETGGAADQAEGGKMFAYFNAPLENANHIEAACSAALRLIESMDRTNAELESSPRLRGVQLHLAIGIASGECYAGPMGHGRSNRYSAIGAAVEMATFLRRQAEYYGPAIICDEAVYRQSHHHFAFLELDRIRTNKSDKATGVYALVGNPFIKSSKSYRALDETHRQLLAAYRAGDWAAARLHLAKAKQSPGAKIPLFDIYEERIQKMSETGAPEGWDGVNPVMI
ncbi:MAG TPA: adenylate/guanylate cyclase domain-containing protein [Parvularculaceae bacterium]|nr:adenylate/guanylate cyclase domain-containing protein [Parvularculaceae bacterium]